MTLACVACGEPMRMEAVDEFVPPDSLVHVHPSMKAATWRTNAACMCGGEEWADPSGCSTLSYRIAPRTLYMADNGSLDIGLVRAEGGE